MVLGGLLRKTAVSEAMSGSRAENLLLFYCCCRSTENGDLAWTAKTLSEHMTFEAHNFLLNKDT